MLKRLLSKELLILAGMILVLAVPFALTLHTIVKPRPLCDPQDNPTPYGYTWSLSLFLVPVLALASWLHRRPESRIQKEAFWLTTSIVAGSGICLDTFFGLTFFTFDNKSAVLGKYAYGYCFGEGWAKGIPIEEFGFYILGALAVLLVYIWGDEFWFGAYNADDTRRRTKRLRDAISFHPASAFWGLLVFVVGYALKKLCPAFQHDGFPGYFLFLTFVAFTPSVLFFPIASPFINWRAFSLGLMFILLVSLFWEATIAAPYQWWRFNPKQMLGLPINGFCGLPVEEPLLWLGVTWATVIIYEMLYTVMYIKQPRFRP